MQDLADQVKSGDREERSSRIMLEIVVGNLGVHVHQDGIEIEKDQITSRVKK